MQVDPKEYEKILRSIESEYTLGKIKNKYDSMLHFAKLTNADNTPEEFHAMRKLYQAIKKHNASVRKFHRNDALSFSNELGQVDAVFSNRQA